MLSGVLRFDAIEWLTDDTVTANMSLLGVLDFDAIDERHSHSRYDMCTILCIWFVCVCVCVNFTDSIVFCFVFLF